MTRRNWISSTLRIIYISISIQTWFIIRILNFKSTHYSSINLCNTYFDENYYFVKKIGDSLIIPLSWLNLYICPFNSESCSKSRILMFCNLANLDILTIGHIRRERLIDILQISELLYLEWIWCRIANAVEFLRMNLIYS